MIDFKSGLTRDDSPEHRLKTCKSFPRISRMSADGLD
jgi:hypothetical protein